MTRNNIILLSSLGFDIGKIKKFINLNVNIFDCNDRYINSLNFLNNEEKRRINSNNSMNYLENFLGETKKDNIKICTIKDDDYPINLKCIKDPPYILYIKGEIFPNEFQLAVIGSRKPSPYGIWACREISSIIAKRNITIVSGLALGIDRIAHDSSIRENNRTIGVLGCGVDVIYPKANKDLFFEIENKGAVISEFPLKTKPFAYNFPRRNRIISAMSEGVIVIEAEKKSGTLITAGYASEQGKDVLSLCGNVNSILSEGTNDLIRKGAFPITSLTDFSDYIDNLNIKKQDI